MQLGRSTDFWTDALLGAAACIWVSKPGCQETAKMVEFHGFGMAPCCVFPFGTRFGRAFPYSYLTLPSRKFHFKDGI